MSSRLAEYECRHCRRSTYARLLVSLAVLAACTALLAAPFAAGLAEGHERLTSFSTWRIHGTRATVTLRLSLLDLSRLPWPQTSPDRNAELSRYVTSRLRLLADDKTCPTLGTTRQLEAPPGQAVIEWDVECSSDQGQAVATRPVALAIESDLLLEASPSHLHFATARRAAGAAIELLLTDAQRRAPLPFFSNNARDLQHEETSNASLYGYIRLGIEHIASGFDHLTFLVALVLGGSSLTEIVKVVTGFTVGHSVTLALATLGMIRPVASEIEALIGLSIALVAAQNLWLDSGAPLAPAIALALALLACTAGAALGYGSISAWTLGGLSVFAICHWQLLLRLERKASLLTRLRWTIASLFGLIHGFGFAGVLTQAQLSPDRMWRALLGFNLGVELGQVALVGVLVPLLTATRPGAAQRLGSAAALALGVYWFISRSYG